MSRTWKRTREKKRNYTSTKTRKEEGNQSKRDGENDQTQQPTPGGSERTVKDRQKDINKLKEQFTLLSAEPFQDVLSVFIGNRPSNAALRAFARKSPDRWAQGVAIFARLSGYTEKKQVHHTGLLAIAHMSDAEIERELQAIGADTPKVGTPKIAIEDKSKKT